MEHFIQECDSSEEQRPQNWEKVLSKWSSSLLCDCEQQLLRFIRGYLAKHNEERHRFGVKLGNPLVSFQRQTSRLLGETSSTGRVVEKNLDFGLDPKDIPDNTFSIIDCYEQYLLSVYDAGFQLRLHSSNSKEVKEAKQMLLDPKMREL
ncbi:hypothetical protein BLNAU_19026 [Blattamonas nauphoetae]|uniref:Uncharacterized protein n=1 Tax=Blattamonas nauphoetae TaxID=2049346 RepID=A0ABQ9X2R6_9EUKA|nr:hypothetical protein BLNAU_19026 [Blattamonas nauphoetae]